MVRSFPLLFRFLNIFVITIVILLTTFLFCYSLILIILFKNGRKLCIVIKNWCLNLFLEVIGELFKFES